MRRRPTCVLAKRAGRSSTATCSSATAAFRTAELNIPAASSGGPSEPNARRSKSSAVPLRQPLCVEGQVLLDDGLGGIGNDLAAMPSQFLGWCELSCCITDVQGDLQEHGGTVSMVRPQLPFWVIQLGDGLITKDSRLASFILLADCIGPANL